METTSTPLSAADVGAVVGTNHNGYGYGYDCMGGMWIWVILIFAIFGFGNGWNRNGNGNGLTQAELQQGFDTQSLLRGQEGIKNGLCDGFYAQNTTMLQGQNALQRDLTAGFSAVTNAVTTAQAAQQNCCCETKQTIAQANYDTNRNIDAANRNIDSQKYESSKNTCDILTAINAEGEKTRALMTQNTIQSLRDKLEEQSQMLQTANFQLSQQAQSANIINTLRPVPIPAYPTCSPYQAANYFGSCSNFA